MPQNIAADPHGNLAVVDYHGNAVNIYTGVVRRAGAAAPMFGGSITLTQSIANPSQIQILP